MSAVRSIFSSLLALACALGTPGVGADPASDVITTGGVVLLMRHATAPCSGDPEHLKPDDCATQRNLFADGRAEAKRIGAHLKKLGLKPGEVLTSQWCRCRETASIAFGGGRDWPALNSFLRQREGEERQKREILTRIAMVKPDDKPLVLVTHQLIVAAITGVFPQSGAVVVVAPLRAGGKPGVGVIGSIKPESAI